MSDAYKLITTVEFSDIVSAILLEEFNSLSQKLGGGTVDDLLNIHKLRGITENLEQYRQVAFSAFRGAVFQREFKKLGKKLIEEECHGKGFLQKTPVIRIHLPKSSSTSYHSDSWYGHTENAFSCWIPLVRGGVCGVFHIAKSLEDSIAAKKKILRAEASLSRINEIAKPFCEPTEANYGQLMIFSSGTMHGTELNEFELSRVSLDFRVVPKSAGFGTKPESNFYSMDDLENRISSENTNIRTKMRYSAVSYSNFCNGVSAKSQLLLATSFAADQGIEIRLNESEIYELGYLPVLRNYIEVDSSINCIICFGLAIFGSNRNLAGEILKAIKNTNKTIIFAAEGIFFDSNTPINDVLSRI